MSKCFSPRSETFLNARFKMKSRNISNLFVIPAKAGI
jgi:hypothetical protein